MCPNNDRFIAEQKRFFSGSYEQFVEFGGPCVYFHRECILAGRNDFLSERHIEMLYATLTAWGMNRMGSAGSSKTKLTEWSSFRASLANQAGPLRNFRSQGITSLPHSEYSTLIKTLQPHYNALKLSISDATVVVNSKALHHLFPELIPPIDRQYTLRFFNAPPEGWRNKKGGFRTITIPKGCDKQFDLFHSTCLRIKRLLDRVSPDLLEEQKRNGVTAPKALDNALVNYIRIVSREVGLKHLDMVED